MSGTRGLLAAILVASAVLTNPPLIGPPLHAQEPGAASVDDLLRAEARIREGRIEEARREVDRWWRVTDGVSTPEVLQFAIWLRAILTVDPIQAERDFHRLVIEFPSGPHAAPARLRLGQSAHARGDLGTALTHYVALDRDYPGTRFRLIARAWLDRYERAARAAARGHG